MNQYNGFCIISDRMKERFGGEREDMEDDGVSKLGFLGDFHDSGHGQDEGSRIGVSDKISQLIIESRSRCADNGRDSGFREVEVDANLNLGMAGESSTSTSQNFDRDNQNKRPKVHTFSLMAGENAGIRDDTLTMDDSENWIDLTDHLLHMVLSFLDITDLCRAARVCRQWRDASSHEDFWKHLNFENKRISPQQFEGMCQRYPNATAVNVYRTPVILPLVMNAITSLRNLEVLTLGGGQLGETFSQALTDCHMLKSLTINDANFFGNGISHDKLRDLQIVKCRMHRVPIRCPQLETLSFKRCSVTHAVLNCPLLKELGMASCHKLLETATFSPASSFPLLESLDMSNCPRVREEIIREITMACGGLRILDVSYCPNISFRSLRLQTLSVLKLHSCDGITSASMRVVNFSDMLEVLELDNCNSLTKVSLDLPRLKNMRLVHCRKFSDLYLGTNVLSSITISNCPNLLKVLITSNALKKLDLQKQERLTVLELRCPCLQEVDLTECVSLTNSICNVFRDGGGCPGLRSLVLDNCESLTTAFFICTSLVSLSLSGCREITSLLLKCPYLEHISLNGCEYLERALFTSVDLKSLNMGTCPNLNVLRIKAPQMVSLELKGCCVLSEALICCPLLTSLDASFCSQLKGDCLSATVSSSPLIESLALMSCPVVGADGFSSLHCLPNLTYLDLSYTALVNLQPVFDSCLHLKVLNLQACKHLNEASLEPLYKGNALPNLSELDLSYGTLPQSAIEDLLANCMRLTHVNLNGYVNMHDLNWGFHRGKLSEIDPSCNRMLENLNCVGCTNVTKVVISPAGKCFHLSSLNLSLSSNLKEVDISCCNLSVLNLSNCNSLEILKLDCPRLTTLLLQSYNYDEAAVETAIKNCRMLETLDVRFCPKIHPSRVGGLRVACPSLKRVFIGCDQLQTSKHKLNRGLRFLR